MAQQAERSPIEDAELPSTPSGSFFQPLPMARHWLRFFTPAEGQKFTPTNPKNHEYLTSLAIILIDSKNYPCFRPFFSQFLPFATPPKTALNCPSRLAFWVRFSADPRPANLASFFQLRPTRNVWLRFVKSAVSSPLTPASPQKIASTSPRPLPPSTLPPPPPDDSTTPNPPIETYSAPPQTANPAPQKPAALSAHSPSPLHTSRTAPASHTTSPPSAGNSATASPPPATPKSPHAPLGRTSPRVGSSPPPQCFPLAPTRPPQESPPASGRAKLVQVPAA